MVGWKRFCFSDGEVIREKDEVLSLAGKPFSVFTPYKNAWLKTFRSASGETDSALLPHYDCTPAAGQSCDYTWLDPVTEPMEMWHLFTHTAGLTYGFMYSHSVDQMYRNAGFEWGTPPDKDLAGILARMDDMGLVQRERLPHDQRRVSLRQPLIGLVHRVQIEG